MESWHAKEKIVQKPKLFLQYVQENNALIQKCTNNFLSMEFFIEQEIN